MSLTTLHLAHDGGDLPITFERHGRQLTLHDGDHRTAAELLHRDGSRLWITLDGQRVHGVVLVDAHKVFVSHRGQVFEFSRSAPSLALAAAETTHTDAIEAPMTGTVRDVLCKPGDTVHTGDDLLVVEAMKMEHRLTAPRDAVIASVTVTPGTRVDIGEILIRLEPVGE
jgi:3-methylcrotonyl-CoA carboxylase alpha subunit